MTIQKPDLAVALEGMSAADRASVAWEVRIQILVDEAISTSAIEGIKLDPKEVRRAVIVALAKQEGLL